MAGLSYHRQKLYERARERLARALELEPEYTTACFFYGFTLFNLGRLDEARAALERYLAAAPDEPEALFGLGLVALEQDRVEDAERRLGQALAAARAGKPDEALSRRRRRDLARYEARLADVWLRRDDLPRARAALERAVALGPELYEPWHKLARVLQRQGDAAGAERAQRLSDEAFRRRTGAEDAGP